MASDGALNYCEGSAAVLRMMCSTAADESQWCCRWCAQMRELTARKWKSGCLGAIFSRKGILLSLLSPVLSLNILLQLSVDQVFANFSDSSDSKNRKNFSYVWTLISGTLWFIFFPDYLEVKRYMYIFALYKKNKHSMPRQKREKNGTGICHVMQGQESKTSPLILVFISNFYRFHVCD